MKIFYLIGGFILLAVLVFGGYWFMFSNATDANSGEQDM